MHYDIAAKMLMEKCRNEILREFLGIAVAESTILEEAPQETVSVKRSDFPIWVRDESGGRRLVLVEIQSRWEKDLPVRLLNYRSRYLLKYAAEVVSCVLLLRPAPGAVSVYEDNEVTFRFRFIPIHDLDAREFVRRGTPCLLPFVPLMRHGEEAMEAADALIYGSSLPRGDKADMLTAMAILSGLVSKELPRMLLGRRRDTMIESAAYDLIKEEGYKEGMQQGMQQGIRQGVIDALEARFELVPDSIAAIIQEIDELAVLKALLKKAVTIDSLDSFRELLSKVLE